MLFNIKSAFFLGLVATSYASPIFLDNTDVDIENRGLEVRAAVEDMKCGNKDFTEAQIKATISHARSKINDNGHYPAHFVNKKGNGNEKVIPTGGPEGLEYPINENGGLWTTGSPGSYRVIGNKGFKKFMGMTMHTGSKNSGRIQACRAVSDIKKEEERKKKEDEEKKKKQSEEDKKKNKEKEEEEEKKDSDKCKRGKKPKKGGCK